MISNNQYQGVTFLVAPFFISCREIFYEFLAAISGYPLNLFSAKGAEKRIPLLSGLGHPF